MSSTSSCIDAYRFNANCARSINDYSTFVLFFADVSSDPVTPCDSQYSCTSVCDTARVTGFSVTISDLFPTQIKGNVFGDLTILFERKFCLHISMCSKEV